MRNRNLAQALLIFVMFGISMAIFLFLAMRGRFWWGVGGALGSYILLFWLTAPYLARADTQTDTPYTSDPIYPPQPTAPLAKEPAPTLSVTQDSDLPTPPTDIWLAEVTNQHGDAIYGHAKQYVPDLYYGRAAQGAVVQLLALEPVWNQYEQPQIKVRVLSDPRAEAGTIGQFGTAVWLGVRNTSLAPYFAPQSTPAFDPEGLRRESKRLWAHYEAYRAPDFIRQPPSFPKGLVIGAFGTAVYGYEQAYDSDAYLTSLSPGTKLILRDNSLRHNQHQIPLVQIEVTASPYASEIGLVGWTTLTNTTFADYYDPQTETLHP